MDGKVLDDGDEELVCRLFMFRFRIQISNHGLKNIYRERLLQVRSLSDRALQFHQYRTAGVCVNHQHLHTRYKMHQYIPDSFGQCHGQLEEAINEAGHPQYVKTSRSRDRVLSPSF